MDDLILSATAYDAAVDVLNSDAGRVHLIAEDLPSGAYPVASTAYATITGSDTSELSGGVSVPGTEMASTSRSATLQRRCGIGCGHRVRLHRRRRPVRRLRRASSAGLIAGDRVSANAGKVVTGGDIDGDGAEDIIIAAPNDNSRFSGGGSVFTAVTGPTMSITDADHRLYGVDLSGALGTALVVSDDHDADGQHPFVAAPLRPSSHTSAGAVTRGATPQFTDADADGFVDADVGGLDRDDDDSGSYPGNTEVLANLADDDCDGWIDDFVLPFLPGHPRIRPGSGTGSTA